MEFKDTFCEHCGSENCKGECLACPKCGKYSCPCLKETPQETLERLARGNKDGIQKQVMSELKRRLYPLNKKPHDGSLEEFEKRLAKKRPKRETRKVEGVTRRLRNL